MYGDPGLCIVIGVRCQAPRECFVARANLQTISFRAVSACLSLTIPGRVGRESLTILGVVGGCRGVEVGEGRKPLSRIVGRWRVYGLSVGTSFKLSKVHQENLCSPQTCSTCRSQPTSGVPRPYIQKRSLWHLCEHPTSEHIATMHILADGRPCDGHLQEPETETYHEHPHHQRLANRDASSITGL